MFPRSALNYYSIIVEEEETEPEIDILLSDEIIDSGDDVSTFKDMDTFFNMLYTYYINHGFYPSILRKIIVLVQYLILTSLVYFLVWRMDYHKTLISKQFFTYENAHTSFYEFIYIFTTFVGWFIYTLYTVYYIKNMMTIKCFCNCTMNLTDSEIQNLRWTEFVKVIQDAQLKHKFYKIYPTLSEYQITQHILRYENILTALVQKHIVTSRIYICTQFLKVDWPYMPKLYEHVLYYCLINPIYDKRKQISINQSIKDTIRKRIKVVAYSILVFSPFIVITLLLYFLFRYFEDFRQNRGTFKSRKWSRYSLWIIKHTNELHHKLHKRMSIAYIYANLYVNSFNNELQTILARFVAFICSIFIVIPLVLSIVDEDFLHVHVLSQDKTVLWFMGISGILYSMAKKYIKDEYQIYLPDKYFQHIIVHTHYDPPEWSNLYHTRHVYKQFSRLFQHKLVYIFEELVSVFIVPWLLLTRVETELEYILDFYNIQIQKDNRYNLGYIYLTNTPIRNEVNPDADFIENILTFSVKSELGS
jgi:Autophagy protein ATG9